MGLRETEVISAEKGFAMQEHWEWGANAARVGVAAVVVAGTFFCLQCLGCQRVAGRKTNTNGVAQCRVSFRMCDGRAFAEICLDEESLINDLVLRPMRDARRDPKPADYAVVGTLTIISADGSRECLVLFSPWGHYNRGDQYFVADFSELQVACQQALRDAQGLAGGDDKEQK